MIEKVAFTVYAITEIERARSTRALTWDAHEVEVVARDIRGPHCRMAVCHDPDGNALILHRLNSHGVE
ncbi:MAG: hypothetical protein EP330_13465 [Deltaproteobacteria bacterium]|nr:MAG: hypothetical protein EP330_13465 [Deltaproteobacteria bacterium]